MLFLTNARHRPRFIPVPDGSIWSIFNSGLHCRDPYQKKEGHDAHSRNHDYPEISLDLEHFLNLLWLCSDMATLYEIHTEKKLLRVRDSLIFPKNKQLVHKNSRIFSHREIVDFFFKDYLQIHNFSGRRRHL